MPPAAAHRRIADDLLRRIHAGEWRPGQDMPSRTALAAMYHVHPQTMRLAVTILRKAGVLEGEPRRLLYVAHAPAVRTLYNPDAPWQHESETVDRRRVSAAAELADRLRLPVGTNLQCEVQECWDPGGRSAMLVTTWFRGRRRRHCSFALEVEIVQLGLEQASALRLPAEALAFRLVRTRLDGEGCPVETADVILPMDRWKLRWTSRPVG